MKTIAIAAGCLAAAIGTSASAQLYFGRVETYDPYYAPRGWVDAPRECWNPRAGHFERVRPGEFQGDLDMRRCRVIGDRYADRYYDQRAYYGNAREECWNPRAGHFEEVRRGEWQDDLDFSRCRILRW